MTERSQTIVTVKYLNSLENENAADKRLTKRDQTVSHKRQQA